MMSALLIDDLMVDEIEGGEPSALPRSGGIDGTSMASVTLSRWSGLLRPLRAGA